MIDERAKKRNITHKQAVGLFRLLSHPARLRILDELRRGAACVCHLQTVLGRPQAYVSQQLKVLRDANVLAANKEGLNVYYRIVDERILKLLEFLLGPAQEPRVVAGCPCPHCAGHDCDEGKFYDV